MEKPSRPVLFLLAVAVSALLGGACGDDPKRPAVTGDGTVQPGTGGAGAGGGAGEGGVADGGIADAGDGGACTDLANTGAIINQNAVNDEVPSGTGGVVTDGTYDLTDAVVYQGAGGLPGPTGNSFQGSIRITGDAYERVMVFRSSAGAASEIRSRGTFTQSDINGTIALVCPAPSQEAVTYSVNANTLTITNLGTKESLSFTKQL